MCVQTTIKNYRFINTSKSDDNNNPPVLFLKANSSRLREVTFELVYVFKPERLKGESWKVYILNSTRWLWCKHKAEFKLLCTHWDPTGELQPLWTLGLPVIWHIRTPALYSASDNFFFLNDFWMNKANSSATKAIPRACDENWVHIWGQRLAHSPVVFNFFDLWTPY